MNKLKSKVFWTIFSILTISVLTIIIIFNTKNYLEVRKNLDNSLNMSLNSQKSPSENLTPPEKPKDDLEPNKNNPNTYNPNESNESKTNQSSNNQNKENPIPLDENTKFLDYTIYTILLNEDNTIKDIINHSNNNISNEEITDLASTILKKSSLEKKHIGNLYLNNYTYAYQEGSSLIIIDTTTIKNNLLHSLELSFILFTILEVSIIIISKLLTSWIIKPVIMSFTKQKQFIEDASHELKTPLSVIIASYDAYEDTHEEKWLKNIATESNHMSNLVKSLLDLATTEQENIKLAPTNLSKLVELSALSFEAPAYEHNLKISYDIAENLTLNLNENSIKQLVEILLDNAIKHATPKSTITISLKENQNHLELLVQNKGEPIPKGEEEKIFERFYRLDKSRNRREGRYGLGLAIAKNIVGAHHGKITASSSNNLTTFKVLFKK